VKEGEKEKNPRKRVRKPGSVRDTKEKKVETDLLKKGKKKEVSRSMDSFFKPRSSQLRAQFQAPLSAQIQAHPSSQIQGKVTLQDPKKFPKRRRSFHLAVLICLFFCDPFFLGTKKNFAHAALKCHGSAASV